MKRESKRTAVRRGLRPPRNTSHPIDEGQQRVHPLRNFVLRLLSFLLVLFLIHGSVQASLSATHDQALRRSEIVGAGRHTSQARTRSLSVLSSLGSPGRPSPPSLTSIQPIGCSLSTMISIRGTIPPSGLSEDRQATNGLADGGRKPSGVSHGTSEVELPVNVRKADVRPLRGFAPPDVDSN